MINKINVSFSGISQLRASAKKSKAQHTESQIISSDEVISRNASRIIYSNAKGFLMRRKSKPEARIINSSSFSKIDANLANKFDVVSDRISKICTNAQKLQEQSSCIKSEAKSIYSSPEIRQMVRDIRKINLIAQNTNFEPFYDEVGNLRTTYRIGSVDFQSQRNFEVIQRGKTGKTERIVHFFGNNTKVMEYSHEKYREMFFEKDKLCSYKEGAIKDGNLIAIEEYFFNPFSAGEICSYHKNTLEHDVVMQTKKQCFRFDENGKFVRYQEGVLLNNSSADFDVKNDYIFENGELKSAQMGRDKTFNTAGEIVVMKDKGHICHYCKDVMCKNGDVFENPDKVLDTNGTEIGEVYAFQRPGSTKFAPDCYMKDYLVENGVEYTSQKLYW